MSVGNGATGVRSNLRRFADLIDDSAADRRPYMLFAPGLEIEAAAWGLDQGNTYVASVQKVYDGITRDIVGVEHSGGLGDAVGRLTQVETLALCRAAAGTYFYDIDATSIALDTYDEAGLTYDSGLTYDQYPQGTLYVHLNGAANPMSADVVVVPLFGFFFGVRGEVHPRLGPNKTSTDLSAWSTSQTGTYDSGLTYDSGETYDADYGWTINAAAGVITITTTGAEAGSAEAALVVGTVVAGKRYMISGEYLCAGTNHANLSPRLLLKAGTDILYSDGRTADAGGYIALTQTRGESRRFFADILVPTYAGDFTLVLQLVGGAGEAGSVVFSSIKVQRIWRYNYYEPRLAIDSLPELEIAATSILPGDQTVGMGQCSIINADGILESIFGGLRLSRKPVHVTVGGAFPDGQQIYADDWRGALTGHTTDVDVTDKRISMPLEDGRTFLKAELPLRNHPSDADQRSAGKPRQLLFGIKAPLAPVRVGVTASGYGIYEAVDVGQAPNGIVALVNGAATNDVEREFVPTAEHNQDITAEGWTSHGANPPESWGDDSDATYESVAATTGNMASNAGSFLGQTIPSGATINSVKVRYRIGNPGGVDDSIGTTPVRPYIRYAGGAALTGALITPIFGAASAWHEITHLTDPDGAAWTPATVFAKAGNALRAGLRSEPPIAEGGKVTFWFELRVVVSYSYSPDGYSTQLLSFTTEEFANRPPRIDPDQTSLEDYSLSVNAAAQAGVMPALVSDLQISVDLAAAQVTLLTPAKLISSDEAGFLLHYTTERGTRSISMIGPRSRTLHGHALLLQSIFNVFDSDVTVTYSTTTQKFSVAKPTGTLTILCKTGNEPARQPWGKMGFETTADLSGFPSYSAARAMYVRDMARDDIDTQPVRAVVHGFRDATDGAYTGTPSAPVEKPPDIVRFLFELFAGYQSAKIDSTTFVAARDSSGGSIPITVHLSKKEQLRSILAKIERTAIADISIDGDGVVYFVPYTAAVPVTIRDFYDRDYLSWSCGYKLANAYRSVRLYYGNDHNFEEKCDSVERIDPGAAVRHGSDRVLEIHTYIRDSNTAQARLEQYFRLATANPRVATFVARGKLIDLRRGDKIRLTRSRALDPTGALDAVVFRVQRLRHNYIDGISHCEAIEDVPFL